LTNIQFSGIWGNKEGGIDPLEVLLMVAGISGDEPFLMISEIYCLGSTRKIGTKRSAEEVQRIFEILGCNSLN
jgi:hypothetical protein